MSEHFSGFAREVLGDHAIRLVRPQTSWNISHNDSTFKESRSSHLLVGLVVVSQMSIECQQAFRVPFCTPDANRDAPGEILLGVLVRARSDSCPRRGSLLKDGKTVVLILRSRNNPSRSTVGEEHLQ